MPASIILRELPISDLNGCFVQVVLASCPTAGFSSNYNTRCILPLQIIRPRFSSLRSLEAEKRTPKARDGFVNLGHKTGNGVLGFWSSKFKLDLQHTSLS